MARKPRPPTTSAERQAAAVEALREAGGRRISVSLPAATANRLDRHMKKMGVSQTDAIIVAINFL